MNFKSLKHYSLEGKFNYLLDRIRNERKIKNMFSFLIDENMIKYAISEYCGNYNFDYNKSIESKIINYLYYGNRKLKNDFTFETSKIIVKNILEILIEGKATNYSFFGKKNGHRENAVAKFANLIHLNNNERKSLTIIDIEQDYNERIIDAIRQYYKIKDSFTLSILKRFSNDQDILNLMIECVLIIADREIESRVDKYTKDRSRKYDHDKYDSLRGDMLGISYLRLHRKLIFFHYTLKEINDVKNILLKLIDDMIFNVETSKVSDNKIFRLLGYKFSIKKEKITLSIDDNVLEKIKTKLNILSNQAKNNRNYGKYIQYIVEVFYEYRFSTNLKYLISRENNRIFRDLHHTKNKKYGRGELDRKTGRFCFKGNRKGRELVLNFWELRELSNKSFSYFNRNTNINSISVDNEVINVMDYIKGKKFISEYFQYIPYLLEKQNFKCYVSGTNLNNYNYEVHRILPLKKGGKNELNNLVIVHKNVHNDLHSKINNSIYKNNKKFKKLYNKIHK